MNQILDKVGLVGGLVGIILCVVSGALRLAGNWQFHGFDLMTFFILGMGLLIAACFLKLQAMAPMERS